MTGDEEHNALKTFFGWAMIVVFVVVILFWNYLDNV